MVIEKVDNELGISVRTNPPFVWNLAPYHRWATLADGTTTNNECEPLNYISVCARENHLYLPMVLSRSMFISDMNAPFAFEEASRPSDINGTLRIRHLRPLVDASMNIQQS